MTAARNVLGGRLETCCAAPLTGFTRTGKCETGPQDQGCQVIYARIIAELLAFSQVCGNDRYALDLN